MRDEDQFKGGLLPDILGVVQKLVPIPHGNPKPPPFVIPAGNEIKYFTFLQRLFKLDSIEETVF